MPQLNRILEYMREYVPLNRPQADMPVYNIAMLSTQTDDLYPHTLYIGSASQFRTVYKQYTDVAFFMIADVSVNLAGLRGQCVEFSTDASPIFLYKTVTRISNDLNRLAEAKSSADTLLLQQEGLSVLVNAASSFLGNPIILYGISSHVLAYSMPEVLHTLPDPVLQEVLENGHMTSHQMNQLGQTLSQRLDDYVASDMPQLYQDQSYAGYPRMTMSVRSGNTAVGLLSVIEVLHTFPSIQIEYLLHLGRILGLEIARGNDLNRDFDQQTLLQLLRGKYPTPEQLSASLISFRWSLQKQYRVLTLQTTVSGVSVSAHFRKFENFVQSFVRSFFHFTKFLLLNDQYLVIIGDEDLHELHGFLKKFKSLLATYSTVAGFSQVFTDLTRTRVYAKQAEIVAYIGHSIHPEETCYTFESYYFYYLLHMARENSNALTDFLHPAVAQVRCYDVEHHTELNRTVYAYLQCHHNIAATAAYLGTHRNTIPHRLALFADLTGLDLEEFSVYDRLLLSYRIEELQHIHTT